MGCNLKIIPNGDDFADWRVENRKINPNGMI